jgi:hypothetical protein
MAFATIDVTKGITGTIPVASGGTGLTSGTTDQFLKFTGTTTIASAADNAGLVYVGGSESTSATSVVSVDNVFSSTYTNYLVVVSRIIPTTGGTDVFFKFRSSVPADVSGNYGYAGRFLIANTGAESSKFGDSQDGVQINDSGGAGVNENITGEGFRMTLNVLNPVGSVQTGYHGTMAMLDDSGYGEGGYIGGIHQADSSIAGITFYMSTGTIARHTIKVYGMVDS